MFVTGCLQHVTFIKILLLNTQTYQFEMNSNNRELKFKFTLNSGTAKVMITKINFESNRNCAEAKQIYDEAWQQVYQTAFSNLTH